MEGFNNFLAGALTLIKIISMEAWFSEVAAFSAHSQPNNICFKIRSKDDAMLYSGMGCGSWLVYPFFLTFHVVMALLIVNLLIATMTSAYD